MSSKYDLIYLGWPSDPWLSYQTSREIDALEGAGLRIGVIPVQLPDTSEAPIPAYQRAATPCSCGLLIVASSQPLFLSILAGQLFAEKIWLRHARTYAEDLATVEKRANKLFGKIPQWVPADQAERRHLRSEGLTSIHTQDCPPFIEPEAATNSRHQARNRPLVVGGICPAPSGKNGANLSDRLHQLFPTTEDFLVSIFDPEQSWARVGIELPFNWRFEHKKGPQPNGPRFDIFVDSKPVTEKGEIDTRVLAALGAGALPLLANSRKSVFGEAAIYETRANIKHKLLDLAKDPDKIQPQWRRAVRAAVERFPEEDFVSQVRAEIGRFDEPKLPIQRQPAQPTHADSDVDTVILCDFADRGEFVWRLTAEIRNQAAAGSKIVLVHTKTAGHTNNVHQAIDACIREGLATVTPIHETWLRPRLLQIANPSATLSDLSAHWPHIRSTQCIVVEDGGTALTYEPNARHARYTSLFGPSITWAATRETTRLELAEHVPTRQDLWPIVALWPQRQRRVGPKRRLPVVGTVALRPFEARTDLEGLAKALANKALKLRILDSHLLPAKLIDQLPCPIEPLDLTEVDAARFLAGLDFLACYPVSQNHGLPTTIIATALSWGIPVLTPNELRPILGAGPIYEPIERLGKAIERLWTNDEKYESANRKATTIGASRHDPRKLTRNISKLTNTILQSRYTNKNTGPSRVLFVTANGVGLGHIARTTALARRLPDKIEPVFATMSQGFRVLEQMGYATELLTTYNGHPGSAWDIWTERHLQSILNYHHPSAIVLDASNPYPGVLRAALTRSDCRLIWIRRGMWRQTQNNHAFLKRAHYFDLIIQPGDIAESYDLGATAGNDDGVVCVPPIRLLDEQELLPPETAKKELGLDSKSLAVLVQLGSGTTRDVYKLVDEVVASLNQYDDIQVVVAQWLNANEGLDLWPSVKQVTGFPLGRYFKAFDFTISAAGYNSFNEILSFGLPAVFIANESIVMDDQRARARFAEERGAAFDLGEADIETLPHYIELLRDQKTREMLSLNARRIARPNGAGAAIDAICGLIEPK